MTLARQNIAPNLPVQQHQFTVDCQRGALLGAVDAGFEFGQPVGIACGRWVSLTGLSLIDVTHTHSSARLPARRQT